MLPNSIHIEPSSRCTLLCPQCPRTEYLDRISVDDCDIDATVRACQDYQTVVMCGNHGDPIYHAAFHQLIAALKQSKQNRDIRITTNGAFRSASWWEDLAVMLQHQDDAVTFSIDGMPDTNHIYRVNSRWPTIESGIKALRRVNPTLRLLWKWILFRHNEHQIMDGMSLAKDLGFNGFMVVNSTRYEDGHFLTPTITYADIREQMQRCK